MAIAIAERPRVAVVDDTQIMRDELGLYLKSRAFFPVMVDEKGASAGRLAQIVRENARVAICDLRLNTMTSASGAEVVAALSDAGFPAILFSTHKEEDLPELRDILDRIPRFYDRDQLEHADLNSEFEAVAKELHGGSAAREPYQTLLRVQEITGPQRAMVTIPAWEGERAIEVSTARWPKEISNQIKADLRLIADVNLEARDPSTIFVKNVRIAEPPDDDDGLA